MGFEGCQQDEGSKLAMKSGRVFPAWCVKRCARSFCSSRLVLGGHDLHHVALLEDLIQNHALAEASYIYLKCLFSGVWIVLPFFV